MNNKPLSRKSNIVVQEFEKEILVYDLKINKAFCLNQTSAMVYQLSDGINSVVEISDLMSVKLKTLVSEDLVWLAMDGLKKDNLLENSDELTNHFTGLSRREVVKKVGLASMAMLPIISSVVAPTAAMAASGGLSLFSNCTGSSQCESGNCNAGRQGFPAFGYCCVPGSSAGFPGDVVQVPSGGTNCNTVCCGGVGNGPFFLPSGIFVCQCS